MKTSGPTPLKTIPRFENEDEERDFWATQESTEYLNWNRAHTATFPDLRPSDDPLGEVDDPIEAGEAAGTVLWADLGARTNRTRLLRDCVTSAEAGRLTGRSRQAIEKLRRNGGILALRFGRQWRYPRWQLDGDSPGGVIAEIPELLQLLHLSPTGAALWLNSSKPELEGATPLQRLQNRDTETVLQLAEQHGHLP